MPPSFVSFSGLYSGYLRRCFTGAGLFSQKIDIDDETTLHVWGPTNQATEKPSLVLIHGFGPTAIWQWRQQVQFLAPHFNIYVPDLIFFGESTTRSKERSEKFQAESVGKLLEKLGLKKCHVVGTSYGGIVAYNMAKMLGEEKIEKVVICSSGVNMTKNHNVKLLERAGMDKIEDLMLPSSTQNLRKLMTLAVAKRIPFMPEFLLKDFLKSKIIIIFRGGKTRRGGGFGRGKVGRYCNNNVQCQVCPKFDHSALNCWHGFNYQFQPASSGSSCNWNQWHGASNYYNQVSANVWPKPPSLSRLAHSFTSPPSIFVANTFPFAILLQVS
ncbi:hypothetical protein KIW84_051188 [Lathyrus oleraceus]|uniref:AB hydrolase-1 domain-containing protein n=1 Tax=Pisum sativum TaxID=3888 RepID=A0A9D5ADD9_PEA|nr:hypothetical protein KIW84_051188 [Pisum sativum]